MWVGLVGECVCDGNIKVRDDEDEKVKHNNASLLTLQYFHFTTHEYTAKKNQD